MEEVVADDGAAAEATVDRGKCSGYGVCADLCPEVFHLDDGGFAYVDGPVPRQHLEDAQEAEHECPTEAIKVEQAETRAGI